jgi:hypothetical protein
MPPSDCANVNGLLLSAALLPFLCPLRRIPKFSLQPTPLYPLHKSLFWLFRYIDLRKLVDSRAKVKIAEASRPWNELILVTVGKQVRSVVRRMWLKAAVFSHPTFCRGTSRYWPSRPFLSLRG